MFKLKLIKPGHSEVDPIIINTAKHVTFHMQDLSTKTFDKSNCKQIEEEDWSNVAYFEIDMNPAPTSFRTDQWVIASVM